MNTDAVGNKRRRVRRGLLRSHPAPEDCMVVVSDMGIDSVERMYTLFQEWHENLASGKKLRQPNIAAFRKQLDTTFFKRALSNR